MMTITGKILALAMLFIKSDANGIDMIAVYIDTVFTALPRHNYSKLQ